MRRTTAIPRATRRVASWTLSLLLALAGCAGPPLGADPFAGGGADSAVSAHRPAPEPAGAGPGRRVARPVELSDEPGVADYVALALARNPRLEAARERAARLAQRVPQARSLPDPVAEIAPLGEMAETAAGQVGFMGGVRQKLPFPGKLEAAGRVRAREAAMARRALERARREVAADTRRAYWRCYDATRAIAVTRESRRLLERLKRIAETKYEAGTTTQQDVLRASVELSRLESELETLRQQRKSAQAMLNRLIDRPAAAPLPDPRRGEASRIEGELEQLLDRAARNNPAVARVRERVARSRAELRRARLERFPDLTVGARYRAVEDEGLAPSATGKDAWWLTFGITLPIWGERLEAAEREALRGVREGLAELAATRNRVAFRVRDAFAKVVQHRRQVRLFRETILPDAEQTVEASRSAYRAGEEDFLTLIDNWRKLLAFRRMFHGHVAKLEQSVAELREAVGMDASDPGRSAEADRDRPEPRNEAARGATRRAPATTRPRARSTGTDP